MDLSSIPFPEHREYESGGENEPVEFFYRAFYNSKQVDLLLGYFSFSAIGTLGIGFAKFIQNGGKMRVVANQMISQRDRDILVSNDKEILINLEDLESAKEIMDCFKVHFFECMAWLLKNERLDIVLFRPKDKNGISHYKKGIFSDGIRKVGFNGSCNFTSAGLNANLESFEVKPEWDSKLSYNQVEKWQDDFNRIFRKRDSRLEYVNVEDAVVAIREEFGEKELVDLLEQESALRRMRNDLPKNLNLWNFLDLLDSNEGIEPPPRFPFDEPRKYQKEAYQNWLDSNRKGLFAMATGTGKTVTALYCVLKEYESAQEYRALILVPSIALANQWHTEVSKGFRFSNIISCNSAFPNWEEDLSSKGLAINISGSGSLIIIATYDTFKGDRFHNIFFRYFSSCLETFTLIADEVHTMGAPGLRKKMPKGINNRIGLSATPERVYDDLGSMEIKEYFNIKDESYTYNYNMLKAIENQVLCEYEYMPIFYSLTKEELDSYKEFSRRLRPYIASDGSSYIINEHSKKLLILRKSIVHKAANKLPEIINIINIIGKDKFNYAFIYVPEGFDHIYASDGDRMEEDVEAERLINLYAEALYDKFKLPIKSFTGGTKNRNEILERFSEGKYSALLAMKCLDEGIDIPRAEIAIFCSSTGNPRQFIQRRGRVLRMHKEKEFARIYDLIAIPVFGEEGLADRQYEVEKAIFKGELRRVVNFLALARNCMDIINGELRQICDSLGIDLVSMIWEEDSKYRT